MTHQTISFVKSAIRILGYLWLPLNLDAAMALLVLSEIIGILEEVGH